MINYYESPENYQTERYHLTGHEFNVLYQINHNVSAFVGYTRSTAKVDWAGSDGGSIFTGNERDSRSGYHVGIIGQTKIADDVTAWHLLALVIE